MSEHAQKCTQTVSLARDMSVAPETGELTMRELADDWRKWSFPERLLALALVLMLIGSTPAWPYSRGWGYYPSGGLGLVLLIVVILFLTGRL